jgi:hypothetical protein
VAQPARIESAKARLSIRQGCRAQLSAALATHSVIFNRGTPGQAFEADVFGRQAIAASSCRRAVEA